MSEVGFQRAYAAVSRRTGEETEETRIQNETMVRDALIRLDSARKQEESTPAEWRTQQSNVMTAASTANYLRFLPFDVVKFLCYSELCILTDRRPASKHMVEFLAALEKAPVSSEKITSSEDTDDDSAEDIKQVSEA